MDRLLHSVHHSPLELIERTALNTPLTESEERLGQLAWLQRRARAGDPDAIAILGEVKQEDQGAAPDPESPPSDGERVQRHAARHGGVVTLDNADSLPKQLRRRLKKAARSASRQGVPVRSEKRDAIAAAEQATGREMTYGEAAAWHRENLLQEVEKATGKRPTTWAHCERWMADHLNMDGGVRVRWWNDAGETIESHLPL